MTTAILYNVVYVALPGSSAGVFRCSYTAWRSFSLTPHLDQGRGKFEASWRLAFCNFAPNTVPHVDRTTRERANLYRTRPQSPRQQDQESPRQIRGKVMERLTNRWVFLFAIRAMDVDLHPRVPGRLTYSLHLSRSCNRSLQSQRYLGKVK